MEEEIVETPAEEVVESPAEEPAEEQGHEAQEDPEDRTTYTGRPAKGNVFARNRVLERENKSLMRRMDELISKLDQRVAQPEEPEEPEIEFADDPLRAIHSRQERIERELKREREEAKRKEQEEASRRKMEVANNAIMDFVEETPDYNDAISHLAEIEFEEALEDNPDLSHEEIDRMLYNKLNEQKLRWIQAGKNPGEELYKKAQRRGYRRQARQQPNAVAELEKERKRASAGSSISKAVGRSSEGRVTAGKIARMTDEEYRVWADELVKKRGGGRIKMRDIMADKMREN